MNGKQFIKELHESRGLLEAYRIGREYLEITKDNPDPAEIKFRAEVERAIWELDQI